MELLYLWVEEYKNIKNQGFNFSPRFECNYDKESNKLTIEQKKDYVNIFPNNINVTAIVGENGSGKSSIAELLLLLFFNGKITKKTKNWILLIDKNNTIFISSLSSEEIDFNNIDISDPKLKNSIIPMAEKYYFKDIEKNTFNLYYNPSNELPSSFFLNHLIEEQKEFDASIYDLDFKPKDKLNIFSFPSKDGRKIDIRRNENISILNMFKIKNFIPDDEMNKILKGFNNTKLQFKPNRVNFELDIELLERNLTNTRFREIIKDSKYTSISIDNLYTYFILFILLSVLEYSEEDEELKDFYFKDKEIKSSLVEKYGKFSNINELAKEIIKDIDKFKDIINKKKSLIEILKENTQGYLNEDVYNLAKLIDKLKELNKNTFPEKLDNPNEIEQILSTLPSFIKTNIIGEGEVKFSDFSTGEKNLISFIYSLLYYIKFYTPKDSKDFKFFNIVLDEVEIGLNPNWQKSIIYSVIKSLEHSKDIKFILTIISHSPFILSDIPRENIIFLKNDKEVKTNITQTFGSNIHTLLSDAFFMKDGLMGDFAKEKINDVIKILKKEEKLSEEDIKICESVISIIGEPILKKTLQGQLELKINSEESELKRLEKKQREIQEKIEELKRKK